MERNLQNSNLDIWGGIECTINRIGDTFLDQLKNADHYRRHDDIERIAGLGIKMLRYPVLWEHHQPQKDTSIDWSWIESRLEAIRSHNIVPVAGLLHHGSGPAFTDLLDDNFPKSFAAYAGQVATKFPWLEYYIPINEPLTTARFSGLYGFWYPHRTDDASFVKMLLNQVQGVVLAMEAIRKINPEAKLVQTEDLGKTYCKTPLLQYQADYENNRRWLSFDLLCGKVNRDHCLWDYLTWNGATEQTLDFFLENPCPPDIMGLNYYVTSERFLDHQVEKYPTHLRGGNWWENYVDVEAVRIKHNNPSGLKILLKEAWLKFNLPMAITEVHLNCSREEQLRWFYEIYESCRALKKDGVDLKAITAWSLFGAYGWNKLLTSPDGDYEPGLFDLRSGAPRPTIMTRLVRSLANHGHFHHTLLDEKGWWHREDRFLLKENTSNVRQFSKAVNTQPILIIGKRGSLGNAFANICGIRAIHFKLLSREELDLCNAEAIEHAINRYRPWAIINAAGFVRVDAAEGEERACYDANTYGPQLLAAACQQHGIKLLGFSSDLVFDGEKQQPYLESDRVNPLSVYGRSKTEMEQLTLQANPSALVIRTSAFFGPWDAYNFVENVISTLSAQKRFTVASDVMVSPTYIPDLVHASLDLLIDDENQIWHLVNQGELTWADLSHEVAQRAGLNRRLLIEQPSRFMGWTAKRPPYSVLKSEKGLFMPSLESGLTNYFNDRKNNSRVETVDMGERYAV